jgi:hypothetical protein
MAVRGGGGDVREVEAVVVAEDTSILSRHCHLLSNTHRCGTATPQFILPEGEWWWDG